MICRTPEEAYEAGRRDGANDRPLSEEEIAKLVALLGPSLANR